MAKAEFSQKGRILSVETPLGTDVLLLEGFSGTEAVSRPFEFTLELLSADPDVDPEALLRKGVTVKVELPDGSTKAINGLISRFTQLGKAAVLHAYQAKMVPWIWFLSLSNDCRIFQKKNVLEIIQEIIGDYSDADFSIKCMASYPAREYCVQYRESDLEFISRLMAEEGIFYFFEHSDSGHKLIIADDPSTIPACSQEEARVDSNPESKIKDDVITLLQREISAHTTSVSLNDYDDLQPSLNLLSWASTGSFEEVYDYPGKFTDTSEGERYARLRLEALSSQKESIRGFSKVRAFVSGHKFTLADHPVSDANKAYLLLSVQHSAKDGSYWGLEAGQGTEYTNQFECIPASVPYRPPLRKEKPAVLGSQTAVVVGPSGEEIYTDAHGRVKVQFHWDRAGNNDEKSSCWVRVSQPWAGKSWGAVAIPRIGQEVIVDFLEGDPDRPIITGRVYNKTQAPPYDLPANKTQTGIKSRSSKEGNGANFNEIRMEDKKGSEQLYIHAEKDKVVVVESDRSESVGHDESITIGNNRTENVGNDETITIGNNRTETVGKNETISIGQNRTETIAANESLSVGENRSIAVGKNESISVGKDQAQTIGKNQSIAVGTDQSLQVGSGRSTQVGKSDALEVGKDLVIQAGSQIQIKTGKASITMKKDGTIQISGKDITIKGSGKINVKASKDIVMKGKKILQN
jgi:type VI secretion system secreted protein VgrG